MISPRLAIAAAATFAIVACSGGVTDTSPPPGGGTDTTGTNPPPGTIQRANITVQVSFDPADAAIAQAAGVGPGGMTVRLQRSGSTNAPQTATTDASGKAVFEQLLQGTYAASVERPLTPAEVAKLPASDRDASVFAGGGQLTLSPPTNRILNVAVVGARRGSLVVSELFVYTNSGNPIYNWGSYLEVYNNSDTTIYLDGIVLFRTLRMMHTTSAGSCASKQLFREDPNRIWVWDMMQFPGGGRDFPIHPGEAKVIAQDALDHQSTSGISGFQNLSNAHFEQVGTAADPDNPVAANMIRGFGGSVGPQGRGVAFGGWSSYGLALPSAFEDFVVDTIRAEFSLNPPNPPPNHPLAGISRELVLDVFSTTLTPARRAFLNSINYGSLDCPTWLNPVFERSPAPLYEDHILPAIRRKSLGRAANEREILQRTRTSARDLEHAQPLRRSLNK